MKQPGIQAVFSRSEGKVVEAASIEHPLRPQRAAWPLASSAPAGV